MKQVIKIGIQDNDIPICLEGEVNEKQLELLITLLQTILKNKRRGGMRNEVANR